MIFNRSSSESDFFSLTHGWGLAQKSEPDLDSLIGKNVFAIWSECHECASLLYAYLPASAKTNTPLKLAGIDCSMNTRILGPALDSILTANRLPITRRPDYKSEIVPTLILWGSSVKDSTRNHRFLDNLTAMQHQLDSALGPGTIWSQAIANFLVDDYYWANPTLDYYKRSALRDRQMAQNLRWLAKVKYPDTKIIVWAHNYHLEKYNGHYPEAFLNNAITTGDVFTRDSAVMDSTYILGFTSYGGEAGRLYMKTYRILHEPFLMAGSVKGNMMHTASMAEWNRVFDGVFFIRDMHLCSNHEAINISANT
jgi:erythromycin esterase